MSRAQTPIPGRLHGGDQALDRCQASRQPAVPYDSGASSEPGDEIGSQSGAVSRNVTDR